MLLVAPYWYTDLNCFTFHTEKMIDCRWIEHKFYPAESPEDCIARKLGAIEEDK